MQFRAPAAKPFGLDRQQFFERCDTVAAQTVEEVVEELRRCSSICECPVSGVSLCAEVLCECPELVIAHFRFGKQAPGECECVDDGKARPRIVVFFARPPENADVERRIVGN